MSMLSIVPQWPQSNQTCKQWQWLPSFEDVVQYSEKVPTSALSCHQIIHYYLFYYKHVFYQVVWLTEILKTAQQRESCMQLSSIVKHRFHVWVKEWGADNSNNANGPPEPGACWCFLWIKNNFSPNLPRIPGVSRLIYLLRPSIGQVSTSADRQTLNRFQ